MKAKILNLPKKGDLVFTIDRCKIETYYVLSIIFDKKPNFSADKGLSNDIVVNLDKYNDSTNSYKTSRMLSDIFLTKEELINQLN